MTGIVRAASLFVLLSLLFAGFHSLPASAAGIDVLDRQRQAPPEPKAQPKLRVQEEAGRPVYDKGLRFTLASLHIEGSTVFKEQELLAPYASLSGTQVSFDAINKIATELTKKYRDKGYLLSRVVLPAQELDPARAEVRLVAVEGYIASVEYVGEEKFVKRFRSYFSDVEQKLIGKRPLLHKDFEREMLLLQDLPGVKVSSRFKEGTERGASILVLTVEPKILDGSLGWGTTGTDSEGPHMFSASLGVSTLPLIGAKTTVSWDQAANYQEYYNFQIAQSYQFSWGLLLKGSYAYSASPKSNTEFARQFDYRTWADTYTLGAFYPIIRSRDMNLNVGLSFEARDSTSDVLASDQSSDTSTASSSDVNSAIASIASSTLSRHKFTNDRLRSVTAKINFDFADEWGGVTQIIPSFTRGLNIFQATDKTSDASNPLAPAEYSKFNLYLSRNQHLFGKFSLFAALSGQLSDSLLSSYNQFQLGGSQFGRGYQPGIIQNDNGVAFAIEPRFTHQLTDKVTIQPYAFYDWGSVWATRHVAGGIDSETISSLGGGVRLWGHVGKTWLPDFNMDFFVAKGLQKIRNKGDAARFGAQVTFLF